MRHPVIPTEVEVLYLVNIARRRCGLPDLTELPRGRIGSEFNCVLARSFAELPGIRVPDGCLQVLDQAMAEALAAAWRTPVHAVRWTEYPGAIEGRQEVYYMVVLPPLLQAFQQAFDRGEYETLEA